MTLRAIGVAIALAACTGNPSLAVPVESLSSARISAGSPSGIDSQATLVVDPSANACDDSGSGVYTATVVWRIENSPPAPVTIRVGAPDGPLFADAGGTTGQAVTGNWVTPVMTFYAVDAAGQVLATVEAPESPC